MNIYRVSKKQNQANFHVADGYVKLIIKEDDIFFISENGSIDDLNDPEFPNSSPNFVHDCDDCVFFYSKLLGDYNKPIKFYKPYDFYYCFKSKTILARYGDVGYEYYTGGHSVLNSFRKEITKTGLGLDNKLDQ